MLNAKDIMEANINLVGDKRMPVAGELNERTITEEKVWEALNEMKAGKAEGGKWVSSAVFY